MRVNELFKIGDVMQSIGGTAPYLDRSNCKVENKSRSKDENALVLHLKSETSGDEGRAYLRVQDEFESVASQLLNWVFMAESIIGLTLSELENLDTGLEIEGSQGRLTIK